MIRRGARESFKNAIFLVFPYRGKSRFQKQLGMLRIMVNNKIFVGPRSLSATEITEQRSKHLRSEWVVQKDDERTSRKREIRRVR